MSNETMSDDVGNGWRPWAVALGKALYVTMCVTGLSLAGMRWPAVGVVVILIIAIAFLTILFHDAE